MAFPTAGVSSGTQECVSSLVLTVLQVHQWLEAQGVLDIDLTCNKDMRILLEAIDDPGLARKMMVFIILSASYE